MSFDRVSAPQGILARISAILAGIVGLIGLVVALMFSALLFVAVAAAGLLIWAYFLWKTRALRREIEAQRRAPEFEQGLAPQASEFPDGRIVIEGEAVRVGEAQDAPATRMSRPDRVQGDDAQSP